MAPIIPASRRASGTHQGQFLTKLRQALSSDLAAVVALTEQAYAPYTALLGAPPIPVTENYGPRIENGEVWLLESDGELAGLAVFELHEDHLLVFSIAVSPAPLARPPCRTLP